MLCFYILASRWISSIWIPLPSFAFAHQYILAKTSFWWDMIRVLDIFGSSPYRVSVSIHYKRLCQLWWSKTLTEGFGYLSVWWIWAFLCIYCMQTHGKFLGSPWWTSFPHFWKKSLYLSLHESHDYSACLRTELAYPQIKMVLELAHLYIPFQGFSWVVWYAPSYWELLFIVLVAILLLFDY